MGVYYAQAYMLKANSLDVRRRVLDCRSYGEALEKRAREYAKKAYRCPGDRLPRYQVEETQT